MSCFGPVGGPIVANSSCANTIGSFVCSCNSGAYFSPAARCPPCEGSDLPHTRVLSCRRPPRLCRCQRVRHEQWRVPCERHVHQHAGLVHVRVQCGLHGHWRGMHRVRGWLLQGRCVQRRMHGVPHRRHHGDRRCDRHHAVRMPVRIHRQRRGWSCLQRVCPGDVQGVYVKCGGSLWWLW